MPLTKSIYLKTARSLARRTLLSQSHFKLHKRPFNQPTMDLSDSPKVPRIIRPHLHIQELTKKQKQHSHDTHAFPPQAICNTYKHYQKMDDLSIDKDLSIVDFNRGLTSLQQETIVPVDTISSELIAEARDKFMGHWPSSNATSRDAEPKACTVYEHKDFPGTNSPTRD